MTRTSTEGTARGPKQVFLLAAALLLGATALAQAPAPKQEREATGAVAADAAPPRDNVGQGTRFARKPLAPGAYFNDRARSAVQQYYAARPPRGEPARWKIGEPLPARASARGVPAPLLSALPKLPPGHRYLQVSGDILLVAASGMVVDGIAAR